MKRNMYQESKAQWNVFAGCKFDCVYCEPSFKRNAKRLKKLCLRCYGYEPHEHAERLTHRLPKTREHEFIFVSALGDVSFCSIEFLTKIVCRIRTEPGKNFLLQSKNPGTFGRIEWPGNVILGTTIETNRDTLAAQYSKSPVPSIRASALSGITHSRKAITIEPILEFDLGVLLEMVESIKPERIWLGYDSKNVDCENQRLKIFGVSRMHWKNGITALF